MSSAHSFMSVNSDPLFLFNIFSPQLLFYHPTFIYCSQECILLCTRILPSIKTAKEDYFHIICCISSSHSNPNWRPHSGHSNSYVIGYKSSFTLHSGQYGFFMIFHFFSPLFFNNKNIKTFSILLIPFSSVQVSFAWHPILLQFHHQFFPSFFFSISIYDYSFFFIKIYKH